MKKIFGLLMCIILYTSCLEEIDDLVIRPLDPIDEVTFVKIDDYEFLNDVQGQRRTRFYFSINEDYFKASTKVTTIQANIDEVITRIPITANDTFFDLYLDKNQQVCTLFSVRILDEENKWIYIDNPTTNCIDVP